MGSGESNRGTVRCASSESDRRHTKVWHVHGSARQVSTTLNCIAYNKQTRRSWGVCTTMLVKVEEDMDNISVATMDDGNRHIVLNGGLAY